MLKTAEGCLTIRTKKAEGGTLTFWRQQREALVRPQRENDRARSTYVLDGGERALSGHGEKPKNRDALTNWTQKREARVRTRKERDQTKHAHFLETSEARTCQDTERHRPSETHSLPGDRRGRDLLEHVNKQTY